ncbi:MAG: hypothetical protein RL148_3037 [Planctomycetota bacterium]
MLLLAAVLGAQEPSLPRSLQDRPLRGCRMPTAATDSVVAGQLWTGGVVPYAYGSSVTPAQQSAMRAAMLEIEQRVNVTFVPRAAQSDWVQVLDGPLNSSPVGRQGGMQRLYVFNWNSRFAMVHELMHVLGFWHEHQRADRDTYVSVQWSNIATEDRYLFEVVPTGNRLQTPYDFDSVMHFGATEGSANGLPTLLVNGAYTPQPGMGQRTALSTSDVDGLRRTYGSRVPPVVATLSPASVTAYQPPPVVLTGQLLDEAVRIRVNGTNVTFTRPTQYTLQFLVPSNTPIGNAQVTVESQAGASNAMTLAVVGNDPPVLVGGSALVRNGFNNLMTARTDNVRANYLLVGLDAQPSVLPGVISLGLGNQFQTLAVLRGPVVGDNLGWARFYFTVPNGVPATTNLWFQSIVLDPNSLTVPISASNVLTARVF